MAAASGPAAASPPEPEPARTALAGPVRVRFAPSPTGFLHVGGARTAIYNDLLRQSLGGAYVLRIEDTDRARSDEAMTRGIEEALRWIGVEISYAVFCLKKKNYSHCLRRSIEMGFQHD